MGENDGLVNELNYRGRHVLLVEDNEINQEIAVAILEELGVTADLANNGKEAVEAFLKNDYALILMDVRMPIMDGLEATRIIRASGKQDAAAIPIIAMTANAMREDREATREAGMNGHIAKPINVMELKNTLGQLKL
jgi:CheY-like chemotaxis protein